MCISRSESWPTIMVIGAFISGILLGGLPSKGDWEPGWDMVSGLGAFAAAVVALMIATRDNRRRDDEADVRARLTAARLYLYLSDICIKLGYVIRSTKDCMRTNAELRTRKLLLNELIAASPNINDADLLALAPLPNRTAYRLAGAIGNINKANDLLSGLCRYDYSDHPTQRLETLSFISFLLTEAEQQIKPAMHECQKAAIALTSPHD